MNKLETPPRERLIRWEDHKRIAEAGRGRDGRSVLAAVVAGDLPAPPVAELVGFSLDEVQDGAVALSMEPQECHYNPLGAVHGGIIATVLDSAMGLAVHSRLPAGRSYTTLEIKVNYLRGVTIETGRVRVTGRVLHFGRMTAMAEASLVDGAGKLCAQASSTCLLFDLPAAKAG